LPTGVIDRCRVHIPWRPGARELLPNCGRTACVRAGHDVVPEPGEAIVGCCGGSFQTVVAATHVTHGSRILSRT